MNDYQKKKFFVNNSVADLSTFKEEHQFLLKLRETFLELIESMFNFWRGFGNEEKMGRDNKRKRFYSEMWGSAVGGGIRLVKIPWDFSMSFLVFLGLSLFRTVLWKLLNTFGGIFGAC